MSLPESAKFPAAIATETDMQNWKNSVSGNPVPTLGGSITASSTSATLTAGTGQYLPADNFTVTIDSEVIFVTSRSTDTLTLGTRGFEGTTATTHAQGANVVQLVTAKSHNQIVSEINAIETQLGVGMTNVLSGSSKNVANGYAGLDAGARIATAQLPTVAEVTTNKNAASGYCGLDGSSHVPAAQTNFGTTSGTVCQGSDSRVTGAEQTANKNAVSGYAGLDASSHLNEDQVQYSPKTSATSTTTVNSAVTSKQFLKSWAVPSGYMNVVGKTLHVVSGGVYSTPATGPTLTINLDIQGANSLGTGLILLPANATSWGWYIEMFLTTMSTGTGGTTMCHGLMIVNTGANTGGASQSIVMTNGSVAVNWTIAQTLIIGATFSSASTSNSITQNFMFVNRLA